MVSAKRLAQIAKKWQRMAALGRKRLRSATMVNEADACCTSMVVKGHCVVYTTDRRRFEVPLVYLGTTIVRELLRMSREEFGFLSSVVIPCHLEPSVGLSQQVVVSCF